MSMDSVNLKSMNLSEALWSTTIQRRQVLIDRKVVNFVR